MRTAYVVYLEVLEEEGEQDGVGGGVLSWVFQHLMLSEIVYNSEIEVLTNHEEVSALHCPSIAVRNNSLPTPSN